MITVAALVSEVRKYWVGPSLDWIVLTKAALLHYSGGIVELVFDGNSTWKEDQKNTIEKYGDGAKIATAKINKKIGLDKYIAAIVAHGVVQNAEAVARASDLYTKILLYCDMRIMMRDGSSHFHERIDIHTKAFEDIEAVLSRYVYIPIRDILPDLSASRRYDLENIDVKHYKNPSA
jgi:hypothetical protein